MYNTAELYVTFIAANLFAAFVLMYIYQCDPDKPTWCGKTVVNLIIFAFLCMRTIQNGDRG